MAGLEAGAVSWEPLREASEVEEPIEEVVYPTYTVGASLRCSSPGSFPT